MHRGPAKDLDDTTVITIITTVMVVIAVIILIVIATVLTIMVVNCAPQAANSHLSPEDLALILLLLLLRKPYTPQTCEDQQPNTRNPEFEVPKWLASNLLGNSQLKR